jgi:hypothetical protein
VAGVWAIAQKPPQVLICLEMFVWWRALFYEMRRKKRTTLGICAKEEKKIHQRKPQNDIKKRKGNVRRNPPCVF